MSYNDNSSKPSGKIYYNSTYVICFIMIAFVAGLIFQFYVFDAQRLYNEASSIEYWQDNSDQIGGQLRDLVGTNETKQMWIDHYCQPNAPMYEQMNKDFCTTMLKYGPNSFDWRTGGRMH